MRKKTLWIITLAIFLLAGCSPADAVSAGMQVTDLTVAVGGADDSGEQQVVSYEITLQNSSQNDVIVRWIEPVLNENISSRLAGDSPRQSIDKTLGANSSLLINGRITLNTSDVTKEEINDWKPFFKDILISTEMKLVIPGGQQ
jgi:hypothetical protein